MRIALLILLLLSSTYSIEVHLKDGSIITGDPICESKTTLVLKEGSGTVSLFKKMIATVDSVSLEGKREFMLGDSSLLKEKNAILFINNSKDSCTIRLRRSPEGTRFLEKSCASGDTITFAVTDGSYFETVRYWRSEGEYFTVGQPVTLETKCGSFSRHEIELKGFLGETIPNLKGPKIAYERE